MNKVSKIIIAVSTAVFASSQTRALSQARERSEISAEHKWKLEDLYSTSFTASTALAEKVLGKEKGAMHAPKIGTFPFTSDASCSRASRVGRKTGEFSGLGG